MSSPHSTTARIRELVPEEMPIVAQALGESPETAIAWYLLWNGACRAWCAGELFEPEAVVIQAHLMPTEPTAFGSSAADIAAILPHLEGWTSLLVPASLARQLERPIADLAGTLSLSTMDDIYHVLDGPATSIPIPSNVRLLTPADEALLGGSDAFTSDAFGEAIIAAAIENDEIVSLAHTFAWSPDYVDLGAMTHEDKRNKGYATAATALVIAEIRKQNKIPVWSCGAQNVASLQIAAKLGFQETSRKTYIIPQRKEEPDAE